MEDFNIAEMDLYELLEVEHTASSIEIRKAYRKKALQCHPDKNPDNLNAAKEFHRLSKVLEVLTDEAAKAAYDKVLKGRKEAALRHKQLDSKRQKLKEDLEAREKQAAANSYNAKSADQKLREEIERLRKEGSRQVEEEMEYVARQAREQWNLQRQNQEDSWDSAKYRIKIKWAAEKHDATNGGYSEEVLSNILAKYGDIVALVVSRKKLGSALVEFKTKNAAEMAMDFEVGLSTNPLKLEWVNGPPAASRSTLVKESDFESIVLTKMRQAEERKRLIEQLKAEDDES